MTTKELPKSVKKYATYLLVMAGLGGLIYGIDVGVIAAALPYIQNTASYTASQLGIVVSAVLWGSVLSSLGAGALSEWLGRKKIIILAALSFFLSIPVICSSGLFEGGSFVLLALGRVLQGVAAGLVGVVVPMYLAECLDSDSRGKGTGVFQFLLTIGLAFAAVIGLVVTALVGDSDKVLLERANERGMIVKVVQEEKTTNNVEILPEKVSVDQLRKHFDVAAINELANKKEKTAWVHAWQTIFLLSAIPGLILFFGAFKLKESPRWLYKKGRKEEALASLAANNGEEKAQEILNEMIANEAEALAEKEALAKLAKSDSIFQRKYVYPFLLAIVILASNQTTGVNSVLNYTVDIFKVTGMTGVFANFSDLSIKLVNVFMTIVACALVDKKGRKFLLKLGTFGVIVGLVGVGTTFLVITKGIIAASLTTGIVATCFFFMFIAAFAVGPGVCAWLALSELMPTRIRAMGMSIAMIVNQGVSATIAMIFPAWKDAWGFAPVFYTLAGFTVIYFITVTFFLPETKGKSLEEIEKFFVKK